MSDLALGDLRLKAAHMLQSPYVRNKGFEMDKQFKKAVKIVTRGLSRKIQSSTHYTVDSNLLNLIWTSVSRKSIRHLVNAFDNAKPPHKNLFIEWQQPGAITGAHIISETREATLLGDRGELYDNPVGMGGMDVISINFYECNENGLTKLMPLEFWIAQDSDTPFGGNYMTSLMSDFLDLSPFDNDVHKLPDDLKRVFRNIHVQPVIGHVDYNEWRHNAHNLDVLKVSRSYGGATGPVRSFEIGNTAFATSHQLSMMTLISVISLVNYDWTVDREPGVIVDSVKSVNTSGVAKDQYKQVKLNLPKSKQVLDFFKQKPRTRKFGTAEHVVRGHWRYYKRTGERVWIGEHTRGDSQYGTVHKDYLLTKRDNFLKQPA